LPKPMVPSVSNPEPEVSIWPYEVPVENKKITDEKVSPSKPTSSCQTSIHKLASSEQLN